MSKRKTAAAAVTAVLIVAAAALWILWPRHPYVCRITLRDAGKNPIEDLSELNAGDTVEMSVEVVKKGRDKQFDAYGMEITVTCRGITYNDDGAACSEEFAVTGKKQVVAQTETVSYMYMDFTREGMSFENPFDVGSCTFTVTDPENAELRLTTGLVYPARSTDGYEIIPGR